MTPLQLFAEAVIGGLFTGLMYSLVALGFVLIYKASTAFNFAQGAMVFFAAMTLVGFTELGAPFWFALLLAAATMILLGVATERFVMRPLVNQHEITLFMATIGLAFMVEGLAQMLWGVDVRRMDLGIQDVPTEWVLYNTGLLITQLDVFAAVVAGVMVATLAVVFSRTKVGRGLRAVADDHAAALAVGIPLQRIWAMVWAVAGIIALVAGMLWGSRAGVQFALALIALKALPVLIIGGFTSVPGVIVAGLIVGVAERTFEVYIGSPVLGGGTEVWFPFVFAILFLLVRPEGLFGEKIIRRV
jgi:branched-chain amino acid transport system permease protein